jgi:hypothetical protein
LEASVTFERASPSIKNGVIPSAAWGSLRQFGRDDRKGFAVERADRRDQSEDEMYCGE